jgi:hypothetical protein
MFGHVDLIIRIKPFRLVFGSITDRDNQARKSLIIVSYQPFHPHRSAYMRHCRTHPALKRRAPHAAQLAAALIRVELTKM